jgi:hypothetical protein
MQKIILLFYNLWEEIIYLFLVRVGEDDLLGHNYPLDVAWKFELGLTI